MSFESAVSEAASMRELETSYREARRRRRKESLIERFFFLTGLTAILILGGIFVLLIRSPVLKSLAPPPSVKELEIDS